MPKAKLQVLITSPDRVLFDGAAESLIFPGEQGTFEVQPLHYPLVSRLVQGELMVDELSLPIRRGLVRVVDDAVTVVVELPLGKER